MSLRKLPLAFAFTGLLVPAVAAYAQQNEQLDPFYADKANREDAAEAPGALVQGSVTSSTFGYRELGETGSNTELAIASPVSRLYTDLRGQLDAKHLGGGIWSARADARVRIALPCDFNSPDTGEDIFASSVDDGCRSQSGVDGGNEYDIRELYVRRAEGKTELQLGRQFVPELAAVEVDGLRVNYQIAEQWAYVAFAGLNPARTSRSIEDDYPAQVDAMGNEGKRILPVTAGVGGAYRYSQFYGSIGAFGIAPLAEENQRGLEAGTESANERPRIALTGNGYWRPSRFLDAYHFVVADVQGADGAALTNLSLGVNVRPAPGLRVGIAASRVDTETLNVIAERDLENPATGGIVQNNVTVLRLASQSARVSLSAALAQQRFEVTVSGRYFERPDIQVVSNGMLTEAGALRGVEVMVSAVDRRSIAGLRLGANLMNIFGIGGENAYRATIYAATVNASRELAGGRGELDLSVGFLNSADETEECLMSLLGCFGSSTTNTFSLASTLFYRLTRSIFAMASINVGLQSISTSAEMDPEPSTTMLSGFLRAAYRF